jgi:hypothetical protein
MKLSIVYKKEKDIENFLKGQQSVNRQTPTTAEKKFSERFDEFNETNLSSFIDTYTTEENYDVGNVTRTFQEQWMEVEENFIKRCEEFFEISYPIESMTAYLTLNGCCTYNIQNKYFFVNIRADWAPAIIMHELLHFYTLKAFGKCSQEFELTDSQYNDIKESLTVLLNTEFKDLMGGTVDHGYPQHQDMRDEILKLREAGLSVPDIFKKLARGFCT